MDKQNKERSSVTHKILTVIGIVLCVILIPILIINCTLLIKGWTNKDAVPTVGSYAPMIVLTDSMSGNAKDAFDGGDLIFIKTAKPEDVKIGDVITFYDPAGSGTSVLSHRVLEIYEEDGKTYFKTKGDANFAEDTAPAPADNLIGIYTGFKIVGAGHVAMFMQTTWGLIICVCLPIILIVGWDAIRRARYNRKHDGEKEQLLAELEELRRLKARQSGDAEGASSADEVTDSTSEVKS